MDLSIINLDRSLDVSVPLQPLNLQEWSHKHLKLDVEPKFLAIDGNFVFIGFLHVEFKVAAGMAQSVVVYDLMSTNPQLRKSVR